MSWLRVTAVGAGGVLTDLPAVHGAVVRPRSINDYVETTRASESNANCALVNGGVLGHPSSQVAEPPGHAAAEPSH